GRLTSPTSPTCWPLLQFLASSHWCSPAPPSSHPSMPCACPHRLGAAGGHARVMPPASASPVGPSPPHGDYSPRICPAVSSHSNSDVTPLKNRKKVSLTKRRMFLPRALVMRV